jgi:hypothetical protein
MIPFAAMIGLAFPSQAMSTRLWRFRTANSASAFVGLFLMQFVVLAFFVASGFGVFIGRRAPALVLLVV